MVTGHGDYTADRIHPNQAFLAVLHSPHAHARILSIDVSRAVLGDGVLGVFTFADLEPDVVPLPCLAPWGGPSYVRVDRHVLANGRVRHFGDNVAFAVAENEAQARNAVASIEVVYEILPVALRAGESNHPPLWDASPSNLCFEWQAGDRAGCDRLFVQASHVTRVRTVNPRIVVCPLEPRSAVAVHHPQSDTFEIVLPSQSASLVRRCLAASLQVAEEKMRVITPDVGGSFGSRIFTYPEYVMVLWAARRLDRPVRWTATRSESFVSDTQGRDHDAHGELALDEYGHFLALRVQDNTNMGAYQSQFGPFSAGGCGWSVQAGAYRMGAVFLEVKAWFTNTPPVDAFRGTGRPEANYLLERLIDQAAFELGMDRADLRALNLEPATTRTFPLANGTVVYGGSFLSNQEVCLKAADRKGFADRRAASRQAGKLRGFGFANYVETNGSFGISKLIDEGKTVEPALIRFNVAGQAVIALAVQSTGQDHTTPVRQLVQERLGLEGTTVTVLEGDTSALGYGGYTGGSRSTLASVAAVELLIEQVFAKARSCFASRVGVRTDEVTFDGKNFRRKGDSKALSVTQIACLHPGALDTLVEARIAEGSDANGCHACEVEVDPETGRIKVTSYTAVDDFGTVLNHDVVEGQVHGGVAQGIGQALMEQALFCEFDGRMWSDSFFGYALPHARDIPGITWIANPTSCPTNDLGFKACGESAATASVATVLSAVLDALRDYQGADELQIPVRAEDVCRLIGGARL
jgi:carbon-monoxide dehydrogenase large subunit